MIETKIELLTTIQREWDDLQSSVDNLAEEQLHLPGVVGEWSIKDVLAHIAAWQARLITSLFKAEQGFTPDTVEAGAAVDRLNKQFYIEMKDRSFEQVWDDLDASYHQLLKRLETWDEEALFEPKKFKWMKGKPFADYIAGDSSEHYAEHAAQIREWRKRQGFS